MAMRHRPYDVLGAERGVAAEEHLWIGGAHGLRVDLWHVPLVEFDPAVALDPWKRIFLTDGHKDIVAGDRLVGFARGYQAAAAISVVLRLYLLEGDTGQL